MTCGDRWPFSSWATVSAAITADCFFSGGYLAIAWSIFLSELALSMSPHLSISAGKPGTDHVFARDSDSAQGKRKNVVCPRFSPVYLAEDDVLGADYRHDIGQHMAPCHLVERCQMGKTRRADLHPVGLVRAVGHDVDAEFPLRVLDYGIGFARRDVDAFGEELEVVDQLFHVALHFDARRRRHLVVVGDHRAGILAQPFYALPDDAVRLPHLLDAHQIPVIAISVHADRNVEFHLIVDRVGLLLPEIPLDTGAPQHGPGEAERERALRRHDADIDRPLLPDAVIGEERLVLVDVLRETAREVFDEVEQRPLAVLVQFLQRGGA